MAQRPDNPDGDGQHSGGHVRGHHHGGAWARCSSARSDRISDGVPAFKAPEWRNARITLTVMGSILAAMFVGITMEAHGLDVRPLDPIGLATVCRLSRRPNGATPG